MRVTQPTEGRKGAKGRPLGRSATCVVGPRVFRPEEGKAVDLQDGSRYLTYAIFATQLVVQSDGIQSAANRAALMAPEDQKSMHLQRLEDYNGHRLVNAFGKVRTGALEKKDVK